MKSILELGVLIMEVSFESLLLDSSRCKMSIRSSRYLQRMCANGDENLSMHACMTFATTFLLCFLIKLDLALPSPL